MADKVMWDTAFPSDYFGHQHMPEDGSDMVIEIKETRMEKIQSQHGTQEKLIAYISAKPDKWIVAKTNAKTINKIYGTTHPYEWEGKKIQVYVDHAVSSPQGVVSAIRVRDFEPK